ncbi:MAG: hypothetical protein P9L94_08045 [Candidatus Hinthialibacter antarcticus]|nr:hypothetical protein [Candidatus Hinthialibacter antarcticus]
MNCMRLIPIIALLFAITAQANVTYEVVDVASRAVELTYDVEDALTGNQVFLFPSGGFIHDDTQGDLEVLSVFDMSTQEELNYEIKRVQVNNNPQLRIMYTKPVPRNSKKQLRIRVRLNAPSAEIGEDNAGRTFFAYETSHTFEFIMPDNHYLVYSNVPVIVFERESQIVLRNDNTKMRNIVIKTRPLPIADK